MADLLILCLDSVALQQFYSIDQIQTSQKYNDTFLYGLCFMRIITNAYLSRIFKVICQQKHFNVKNWKLETVVLNFEEHFLHTSTWAKQI